MIENKERKYKVSPAIEYIRYNEPKILTYLSVAICLLMFFIGYSLYTNHSVNKRLSKIESYVNNNESNIDNLGVSLTNTITTEFEKIIDLTKKSTGEVKTNIDEPTSGEVKLGLL